MSLLNFSFIIIFLPIYTLAVFLLNRRKANRLSEPYSKYWRALHLCFFVIVMVVIIINLQFNIDLQGLWTSRICWFIFLVTGIFYSPIGAIPKQRISNLYFKLFSYLPTFSMAFTFVPFLGVVLLASCLGQLFNPAHQIFYEDSNLRVESKFKGVLAPAHTDVVEKEGLIEKTLLSKPGASQTNVTVRYSKDSIYINFIADSRKWEYHFKRQ